MSTLTDSDEAKALTFINNTFDQILSEIEKRPFGKPEITLQRVVSCDIIFDADHHKLGRTVTSRQISYSWPGRNEDEAWRFTCVGKILSEIKVALESRRVVTKRDIYYRDPTLFRNQQVVDKYIDDIAHTCKVTRGELNVAASPHGLYAGLRQGDDTVYSITEGCWDSSMSIEHLKWLLIVEKEATFKQLVEQKFHSTCSRGAGMIVTGRGYPDLATRRLVQNFSSNTNQQARMFGLFDADPDGLAILNCYRYGSKVTAQELEPFLMNVTWLGVKLEDIDAAEFMPLSTYDRTKARAMLSKSIALSELMEGRAHRDSLQHMLILNMKAEIQALQGGSEALFGWLEKRMEQYQT